MRNRHDHTIRKASIRDIEGINLVSSSLGYAPSSKKESKKRLQEILASDNNIVWVFEEDNTIKGWLHLFVAIRLASTKFAEIGGLVVDNSYRRLGIGRELIEVAVQWSGQNNLALRVRCNSQRKEANTFYESLGFYLQKTQNVYEYSCS